MLQNAKWTPKMKQTIALFSVTNRGLGLLECIYIYIYIYIYTVGS